MAQNRIRQSRLPEILAQFGKLGPGPAIQSGLEGFKEGASLAATLAAKKQDSEFKKLQLQQIETKIKASQDKLAGQEKLAAKQKQLEEVGTQPVTSIPLGQDGGAFPTLSDVALSEPRETSNLTGQRGKDISLETDNSGINHRLINLPETQRSTEQFPTEQTGETLIPGIKQGLESQVSSLQRQAFPDAAKEQQALEAFPKPLTDLEESQAELNRAKVTNELTGGGSTMTAEQANALLGSTVFPPGTDAQIGMVKKLLGRNIDPAISAKAGREVTVLNRQMSSVDKEIQNEINKTEKFLFEATELVDKPGLFTGDDEVDTAETKQIKTKLRRLYNRKNSILKKLSKHGGDPKLLNIEDEISAVFTGEEPTTDLGDL